MAPALFTKTVSEGAAETRPKTARAADKMNFIVINLLLMIIMKNKKKCKIHIALYTLFVFISIKLKKINNLYFVCCVKRENSYRLERGKNNSYYYLHTNMLNIHNNVTLKKSIIAVIEINQSYAMCEE